MKAAVLDTQAAAKFSTAAALASKQSGQGARVDWRDNTLATASPPRDQPRHKAVRTGFFSFFLFSCKCVFTLSRTRHSACSSAISFVRKQVAKGRRLAFACC